MARTGGRCPKGQPRRARHDHEVPFPPPRGGDRPKPREGPRRKGVLPRSGEAGRPGPPATGTSGEGNGGLLLLVVDVVRQQRVERELQRWQREREQQEQQQLRSRRAGRLVIGPDLFPFRALWRQYRGCRRNKRNTHSALAFEVGAEAKLLVLQQELRDHTYRPGRSICFVTGGPKPREVFAADFRDRIVHHVLAARQERVFERFFGAQRQRQRQLDTDERPHHADREAAAGAQRMSPSAVGAPAIYQST